MKPSLLLKKVNNKLFNCDERAYRKRFLKERVTPERLEEERNTSFPLMPKISILVPVFRTPLDFLNDMAESVVLQSYGNWELILANASPECEELNKALAGWQETDSRITVFDLPENAGISENTNRAYEKATGEFIALFDHDDMLEPDVLFEYVKALNEAPETDVFYCDEDKITEDSNRFFFPNCKPDFLPDTLYSNNYICHFLMMRRTVLERIGGWRKEYDGAQDFDLVLRLSRETKRFVHVPKILYHWRSHSASTAKSQDTKSYAATAGARAVSDHFAALGIPVRTEPGVHAGWIRLFYPEIPESGIRVIYWNPSEDLIENIETELRDPADYVLLIRKGLTVPGKELLSDLAGPLRRKEAGLTAPRLLFPDGTVYRNGFHLTADGKAYPYFAGFPADEPGFMCRNLTTGNVMAVSGEMVMLRRETLTELLPVLSEIRGKKEITGDPDVFGLCLSSALTGKGYLCVQRSECSVYVNGPFKRPSEAKKPVIYLLSREKRNDPCYNPNFDEKGLFEVRGK